VIVIVDVLVLVDVDVDGFGRIWLRSGPFEGLATPKPPALPEDTCWLKEVSYLNAIMDRALRKQI
jgi:hypothetical protein